MGVKQAIVVRTDLKMGKGKIASQVAHASLQAFLKVRMHFPKKAERWLEEGGKKIVLKVKGLEELLDYAKKCEEKGIPIAIIRDAGHTQVEPGTITCFAAGPWEDERIDEVLGKLKLL